VLSSNARKIADRTEKLDGLDSRADYVADVAGDYQSYSQAMLRKEQKKKLKLVGGVLCVFLLILLPWWL
jgi:uncharacterized protein (DUF3084 family)